MNFLLIRFIRARLNGFFGYKYNLFFDRLGIEFPYYGDSVLWLYPWTRKGGAKYVSIQFSGTGDFGDARFHTLKEIKAAWDNYNDYCADQPYSTTDIFDESEQIE